MYQLLTDNLADKFAKRVAEARLVRVASAWVTESNALGALVDAKCKAKVLVGTHGNATDPEAVRRLIARFRARSVRIVDSERLFHPKLFHFESSDGKTWVWIGSANFTGGGFGGNRELLLETDAGGVSKQAAEWFDKCWKDLSRQNVEAVLERYAKRWQRNNVPPELMQLVEPSVASGGTRLQFIPTEGRKAGRYTGELAVSGDGSRQIVPYRSATYALREVLEALRGGRRGFLGKCARNGAFRQVNRNGGTSQFLARDRNDIREVRAARGDLTEAMQKQVTRKGIQPLRLANGWWVSRYTNPQQVWNMICAAAAIGGVEIEGEGLGPGF